MAHHVSHLVQKYRYVDLYPTKQPQKLDDINVAIVRFLPVVCSKIYDVIRHLPVTRLLDVKVVSDTEYVTTVTVELEDVKAVGVLTALGLGLGLGTLILCRLYYKYFKKDKKSPPTSDSSPVIRQKQASPVPSHKDMGNGKPSGVSVHYNSVNGVRFGNNKKVQRRRRNHAEARIYSNRNKEHVELNNLNVNTTKPVYPISTNCINPDPTATVKPSTIKPSSLELDLKSFTEDDTNTCTTNPTEIVSSTSDTTINPKVCALSCDTTYSDIRDSTFSDIHTTYSDLHSEDSRSLFEHNQHSPSLIGNYSPVSLYDRNNELVESGVFGSVSDIATPEEASFFVHQRNLRCLSEPKQVLHKHGSLSPFVKYQDVDVPELSRSLPIDESNVFNRDRHTHETSGLLWNVSSVIGDASDVEILSNSGSLLSVDRLIDFDKNSEMGDNDSRVSVEFSPLHKLKRSDGNAGITHELYDSVSSLNVTPEHGTASHNNNNIPGHKISRESSLNDVRQCEEIGKLTTKQYECIETEIKDVNFEFKLINSRLSELCSKADDKYDSVSLDGAKTAKYRPRSAPGIAERAESLSTVYYQNSSLFDNDVFSKDNGTVSSSDETQNRGEIETDSMKDDRSPEHEQRSFTTTRLPLNDFGSPKIKPRRHTESAMSSSVCKELRKAQEIVHRIRGSATYSRPSSALADPNISRDFNISRSDLNVSRSDFNVSRSDLNISRSSTTHSMVDLSWDSFDLNGALVHDDDNGLLRPKDNKIHGNNGVIHDKRDDLKSSDLVQDNDSIRNISKGNETRKDNALNDDLTHTSLRLDNDDGIVRSNDNETHDDNRNNNANDSDSNNSSKGNETTDGNLNNANDSDSDNGCKDDQTLDGNLNTNANASDTDDHQNNEPFEIHNTLNPNSSDVISTQNSNCEDTTNQHNRPTNDQQVALSDGCLHQQCASYRKVVNKSLDSKIADRYSAFYEEATQNVPNFTDQSVKSQREGDICSDPLQSQEGPQIDRTETEKSVIDIQLNDRDKSNYDNIKSDNNIMNIESTTSASDSSNINSICEELEKLYIHSDETNSESDQLCDRSTLEISNTAIQDRIDTDKLRDGSTLQITDTAIQDSVDTVLYNDMKSPPGYQFGLSDNVQYADETELEVTDATQPQTYDKHMETLNSAAWNFSTEIQESLPDKSGTEYETRYETYETETIDTFEINDPLGIVDDPIDRFKNDPYSMFNIQPRNVDKNEQIVDVEGNIVDSRSSENRYLAFNIQSTTCGEKGSTVFNIQRTNDRENKSNVDDKFENLLKFDIVDDPDERFKLPSRICDNMPIFPITSHKYIDTATENIAKNKSMTAEKCDKSENFNKYDAFDNNSLAMKADNSDLIDFSISSSDVSDISTHAIGTRNFEPHGNLHMKHSGNVHEGKLDLTKYVINTQNDPDGLLFVEDYFYTEKTEVQNTKRESIHRSRDTESKFLPSSSDFYATKEHEMKHNTNTSYYEKPESSKSKLKDYQQYKYNERNVQGYPDRSTFSDDIDKSVKDQSNSRQRENVYSPTWSVSNSTERGSHVTKTSSISAHSDGVNVPEHKPELSSSTHTGYYTYDSQSTPLNTSKHSRDVDVGKNKDTKQNDYRLSEDDKKVPKTKHPPQSDYKLSVDLKNVPKTKHGEQYYYKPPGRSKNLQKPKSASPNSAPGAYPWKSTDTTSSQSKSSSANDGDSSRELRSAKQKSLPSSPSESTSMMKLKSSPTGVYASSDFMSPKQKQSSPSPYPSKPTDFTSSKSTEVRGTSDLTSQQQPRSSLPGSYSQKSETSSQKSKSTSPEFDDSKHQQPKQLPSLGSYSQKSETSSQKSKSTSPEFDDSKHQQPKQLPSLGSYSQKSERSSQKSKSSSPEFDDSTRQQSKQSSLPGSYSQKSETSSRKLKSPSPEFDVLTRQQSKSSSSGSYSQKSETSSQKSKSSSAEFDASTRQQPKQSSSTGSHSQKSKYPSPEFDISTQQPKRSSPPSSDHGATKSTASSGVTKSSNKKGKQRCSIGELIRIDEYSQKEWKGNTEKATTIRNGYSEVLATRQFRHLRQIRGDNYCALRSPLYQILANGVSPECLANRDILLHRILQAFDANSHNFRSWTFANHPSLKTKNKRGLMEECVGALFDLVEKARDIHPTAREAKILSTLNKNPTYELKLLEGTKLLMYLNALDLYSTMTQDHGFWELEKARDIHPTAREAKILSTLNKNPTYELKLLEGTKLLMYLNALDLYSTMSQDQEVPVFVWLMYARDTSENPGQLLRNHLNLVGDSAGLEQIEMFLLAHTLGVTIHVYRLNCHGQSDFIVTYPEDAPPDWPTIYLVAEDDRHYNVLAE